MSERMDKAKHLTMYAMQYLQEEQGINGRESAENLCFDFLASYIATVTCLFMQCAGDENAPQEEQEEAALETFAEVKHMIQESVAAGVAGAMTTITGFQSEYYCQVKPVPETVNKFPA
jgi:hypothetical protein